jgi:hypothetical protein
METISKEEFLTKVEEILVEKGLTEEHWEYPVSEHAIMPYGTQYKKPENPYPGLLLLWSTGGITGGDCWSQDEQHAYISDEPAPTSFRSLEAVLENISPDMSYLTYRKLKPLILNGSSIEQEYYGNSTNHVYQYISLEKLYEFMVEEKLIANPDFV